MKRFKNRFKDILYIVRLLKSKGFKRSSKGLYTFRFKMHGYAIDYFENIDELLAYSNKIVIEYAIDKDIETVKDKLYAGLADKYNISFRFFKCLLKEPNMVMLNFMYKDYIKEHS